MTSIVLSQMIDILYGKPMNGFKILFLSYTHDILPPNALISRRCPKKPADLLQTPHEDEESGRGKGNNSIFLNSCFSQCIFAFVFFMYHSERSNNFKYF